MSQSYRPLAKELQTATIATGPTSMSRTSWPYSADGRLSFAAAHDYERMQRHDVQAMKARVNLEVDLEMDRVGPRYQALVEVSTTSGQQLREQ